MSPAVAGGARYQARQAKSTNSTAKLEKKAVRVTQSNVADQETGRRLSLDLCESGSPVGFIAGYIGVTS
jgi:hypothetical protein